MSKKVFIVKGFLDGDNGVENFLFYRTPAERHEICKFVADCVIRAFGDGDSENGGMGSLKNCYDEICKSLFYEGRYEYANCRFTISELLFSY